MENVLIGKAFLKTLLGAQPNDWRYKNWRNNLSRLSLTHSREIHELGGEIALTISRGILFRQACIDEIFSPRLNEQMREDLIELLTNAGYSLQHSEDIPVIIGKLFQVLKQAHFLNRPTTLKSTPRAFSDAEKFIGNCLITGCEIYAFTQSNKPVEKKEQGYGPFEDFINSMDSNLFPPSEQY